MEFKKNLEIFLIKKGISKTMAGEILGFNFPAQSLNQKIKGNTWTLEEAYKFAAHFKCSIEEIFGGVENEK